MTNGTHDDNRISLRDFVERRLDDYEKDHEALHKTADKSREREAFLTDKALNAAETARATALQLATTALDEWKTGANEFRGTLSDQATRLATREEVKATQDGNERRLGDLERANLERVTTEKATAAADSTRHTEQAAQRSRQQWVVGITVSIAAIVSSVVINLAIRLITQG